MTDVAFERDLRAYLEGSAPTDVPRSLATRIASLDHEQRSAPWFRRLASAVVGGIAIVLVAVLGAVVVLRTGWGAPIADAGAGPKAFMWGTQMATLEADRLSVEAGGRTFEAPQAVDYIISDPGSATYRTLELAWRDAGTEMRLNVYFGASSTAWWIEHIRTYDGREPGDWIYYLGPSFRTPLGEPYSGDVDLFGLGIGGIGRLQIAGMTLSAFEPGSVPPAFNSCRTVGPGRGSLFGPPVAQSVYPDLSEFGITEGMAGTDAQTTLVAQGICHEFRVEFPSINRGQIWCTAPPGKVREFRFGSAGQIIVLIEDPTRLPLDTELPQVVGC